nr:uncharacterized protein LOC113804875 [Penaeus vannamei]
MNCAGNRSYASLTVQPRSAAICIALGIMFMMLIQGYSSSEMWIAIPESLSIEVMWYEAVILRTGNALAYKQVVVSGEDLYVTETPPRSLSHLLHAAQISDVSLVHDLPEFLRGGVRDQTTHVIVRFRSSRRASLAKAKVRRSTVEEPSTSSIDEEGDEEESDETDAPATHVLARAAHDTASVCSDPVPSLSLPTVDGGHANNRSYPSSPRVTTAVRRNSSTGILAETSPLALATAHALLSPRNGAKRPARAPSPDMDAVYHGRSITPTIAELLAGVSPVARPQLATRSSTPDSLARARMPRSLSALESYHRSSPLALDLPSRSKSVLDKPSAAPGSTPTRSQSLDLKDLTDGHRNDEVLHLYTLSTSTLLFHLLHSLWVASTLVS